MSAGSLPVSFGTAKKMPKVTTETTSSVAATLNSRRMR